MRRSETAEESGSRWACRRWHESCIATFRLSGWRDARGSTSLQELAQVAHAGRERRGPLGPGRVVAEHVPELLQMRATAGGVDDHRLDAVERLDHAARERAPFLAAPGVHRESAATALRRRDDLVAVGCENPCRRRVDRPEHHGLDATCENADTPAGLATRGRNAFRPLGRAPGWGDLGHRAEPAGQRELAAERCEAQGRAHPARVGEELEERATHEPVAERPAGLGLDRLAGRLDQLLVLDPRGAGRDAGHAAEALVEVPDHGRVERDRAVEVRLHQLDPAARGVHLLAPEQVRRARRQAEAAVDAVARQRAQDVGRSGHARTPAGSKRSRTRSWRRRTGSGVASAAA